MNAARRKHLENPKGISAIIPALDDAMVAVRKHPTLGDKSQMQINPEGVDLSRLGNGERNSAKPKAREGRASGSERVHQCAVNGDATPLGLKLFLGR